MASYRLSTPNQFRAGAVAGSLNTYALETDAFSDEAQQIGLILAAHASAAVGVARERDSAGQLVRQLHEALGSRDVIGQAKGILMERLKLPPEDAFDVLRRASQHLHKKLREVAEQLAATGQLG